MDLRRLRYFAIVAEERHVTRAAARLGIQQAPLSQQIKLLEAEIGTRLFVRKPRGVELTEAGRTLLAHTQRIFENVERAVATTRQVANGARGTIRLGLTTSASLHPLPASAVRAFRRQYPDVTFELVHDSSAGLMRKLQSLELHAAFTRTILLMPDDLQFTLLQVESMVAALPANHRLARRKSRAPLPLKEFAQEVFVGYPRGSGAGLYDALLSACRASGFSPHIAYEAPQIVSTLSMVAAGLGVTIVPRSLEIIRMKGIVFRPVSIAKDGQARLILVTPKQVEEALVKAFREIALSQARSASISA
jgi:DNA-binding transcriptional LysR family regulator